MHYDWDEAWTIYLVVVIIATLPLFYVFWRVG